MTLKEFNKLDYDAQLLKVVDDGVFLDNYISTDVRINLYALAKFYVELVYDPAANRINEIRSFIGGPNLDKYTKSIYKQ